MNTLIAIAARAGIPERFQRATAVAASLVAVVLLCAALWLAWTLLWRRHDAEVISRSDAARSAAAVPALDNAAEQRAMDAIGNAAAEQVREAEIAKAEASEAAKPIQERVQLPATTIALNCARLRRAYSAAELAAMAAYQEHCR